MSDLALLQTDITTPFGRAPFGISRRPFPVGRLPEGALAGELPCCLDMAVKLPGGDFVVPSPYDSHQGVMEFIRKCAEFEDGLLPGWRETHFAYLTVDQREVPVGKSHRSHGWHFDGMQGSRYPTKLPACHEYVVSDRLVTEFTDAVTDASGLCEETQNWFEELGGQVPESHPVHVPEPMQIVAMSAYQLHRSAVAKAGEEGLRTFLRLDISLKAQDRIENTVNPDLEVPFKFVPRPMPAGLARPISDAGWSAKATVFGAPISG